MNGPRGELRDSNNVICPEGPAVGLKIQWPYDVALFRNHV